MTDFGGDYSYNEDDVVIIEDSEEEDTYLAQVRGGMRWNIITSHLLNLEGSYVWYIFQSQSLLSGLTSGDEEEEDERSDRKDEKQIYEDIDDLIRQVFLSPILGEAAAKSFLPPPTSSFHKYFPRK